MGNFGEFFIPDGVFRGYIYMGKNTAQLFRGVLVWILYRVFEYSLILLFVIYLFLNLACGQIRTAMLHGGIFAVKITVEICNRRIDRRSAVIDSFISCDEKM